MLDWVKTLFNSDPLKTVGDAIDKFTFTEQERTEANKIYLETLVKYQEATQPQNVARRFLSVFVAILAAFFALGAAISYPFNHQYAEFLLQLFNKISLSLDIVIAFYFAKGFFKSKAA